MIFCFPSNHLELQCEILHVYVTVLSTLKAQLLRKQQVILGDYFFATPGKSFQFLLHLLLQNVRRARHAMKRL